MCNGDIFRAKINYIKGRLQAGVIDYDTAKAEAAPVIAEMNARGAEIAKKYGMRHKPLTFGYLMR